MGIYANFWSLKWLDNDTVVHHRIASANRNEKVADIVFKNTVNASEDNWDAFISREEALVIADLIENIDASNERDKERNKEIAGALREAAADEDIDSIRYELSV